ncbi:hypothetical protein CRE_06990 [Caenorhabditis remanei]|uniref:B box-type domain-containing protein n=1 Tax=Caenorhabditis remanei TaxID=31234 RepID=E3NB33_CAERE|nr:hypothetical protein CRE_06990 [Caenorhabditis remanei]
MSIEYLCNSQTGRADPSDLFFNSNEPSTKNFTIEWRDNSKRKICLITTLPTWLTMESPKGLTKSPYRFEVRYDPIQANESTCVQLVFELEARYGQKMTVSINLNFWQGMPREAQCCNCATLKVARNTLSKFKTLCGHTLCQRCLKMKLKSTRIKKKMEKEKETFFKYNKCPECQRNIYERIPVQLKPTPLLHERQQPRENMQVMNENQVLPAEYPCTTCKHESDVYCFECKENFCNSCSIHWHKGEYSGHRFTNVKPLEVPSQPPSLHQQPEPDIYVEDFRRAPSRLTSRISCEPQNRSPKTTKDNQTRLGQNLGNLQQMATRLKEAGKFLKTKVVKMPGIRSSFNMENKAYKTMKETILTKFRGQPQLRNLKLEELNKFLKDKEKTCQDALLSLEKDRVKIDDLRKWIDLIRKREKDVLIDMEDVTNQVERACRLVHRWNIAFHPLNDYHIPKDVNELSPMIKPSRKRPHG